MPRKRKRTPAKGKALLSAGQHEDCYVTAPVWVPATEGQYAKATDFIPNTPNQTAEASAEVSDNG